MKNFKNDKFLYWSVNSFKKRNEITFQIEKNLEKFLRVCFLVFSLYLLLC